MQPSRIKATLKLSIVVIAFCLLLVRCTEVPLVSTEITAGKRQVSGSVRLEQSNEFKNIYVWLEGFDIATTTDKSGNFSLTLPPPSSQNARGGITGLFSLYFYLANYFLATSEVLVHDGVFLYSNADLNKNGELLRPKILTEFLRIATHVITGFNPHSLRYAQGDSGYTAL